MSSSLLPLLLLGMSTGCRNACQQLCQEIAEYALEECDLDFGEAELDACYDLQKRSNLEKGDAKTCRENDVLLRDVWSCDDLEDYFDAPADAADNQG